MDSFLSTIELSEYISIAMLFVGGVAIWVSYTVYSANISPEVIIYVDDNPDAKSIINLVIKNIGRGVAKNIKFKPNKALPKNAFGFEEAKMPLVMDEGPIITGISNLAPDSSRVIMFGRYHGLEKWFEGKSIDIEITYERSSKLPFKSKYIKSISTLDVYSFATTDASDNSHAKKLVDEIKKLKDELSSIKRILQNITNKEE